MIRRPPISTRTYTLVPYTTLFRSSVKSVRVVDVIPGKSVVGLETPNTHREMIYLSELLRSKEYDKASSALTLALGKDIAGRPTVADLSRMPHLLVAGTTGSGKSVAGNRSEERRVGKECVSTRTSR